MSQQMMDVQPAGSSSTSVHISGPTLRSRQMLVDLALTLPFIALFWLNLAHHEFWLDELNAWGISAASPTLRALFANVHYEGHPWLWYFVLWIPSRFTHDPVAMKWVEAVIGAAIYLVIGLLSPFTRVQKLLFFLNYFVAFEYTVISRTYGLMLLFALLYVCRRAAKPQAWIANLALLGALANTDLTGIMLSGALLLEYAASVAPPQWRGIAWRRAGTALALYMAMVAVAVETLLPAPDISWFTTGRMFSKAGNMRHLWHSIGDVVVGPWWPFPSGFPYRFWDTDVAFTPSEILFIPVVLAGIYWTFRRRGSLLILMAAAELFAFSFAHLIYIGYPRHWGMTVAAYLCGIWIVCRGGPSPRNITWVAYLMLAVGSVKAVGAMVSSRTHPFSETANAAQWLRDNHLDQQPLVGSSDFALAGVAEQLERSAYFLDCNCVDSYMKFAHRRDGLTADQLPSRILRAQAALGAKTMVLVMDSGLTQEAIHTLASSGLDVRPLAQFHGSEDGLSYYLYSASDSAK